jgi:hypothetical protein
MTNSHAVLKGAALRVNAKDGSGVDIFEIPASGWIHHQDGDDVAMAPIRQAPSQGLLAVNIDQFLTEELAVTWGIAPGDDCFFIGRHMYLDGKARNTPAVRFGNLSILTLPPDVGDVGAERGQPLLRTSTGSTMVTTPVPTTRRRLAHTTGSHWARSRRTSSLVTTRT